MSYAAAYHAAPARATAIPPRPAARPVGARPVGPAAGSGYGGGYSGGYGAGSSAARYRNAELDSAAPGQLVVMLFDKCLLTVRRAQAAFAAGDVEARAGHVCAAADMVTELRGSLDFAAGGAIATQLDGLYGFVLAELFAANRQQAPAKLGPVLHVLGELREAFAGAQAQLAAAGSTGAAARGA